MKTKISLLIVTILMCLQTGCEKKEDQQLIEFTTIGQGNLYGNGGENIEQQNSIITDSNSWMALMDKMNSVNNTSETFTEIEIDFSTFTLIGTFDKIYGNGGNSIDIISLSENDNKINIEIKNILKGDATLVMSQPYHIIKIHKTDKLIIFN